MALNHTLRLYDTCWEDFTLFKKNTEALGKKVDDSKTKFLCITTATGYDVWTSISSGEQRSPAWTDTICILLYLDGSIRSRQCDRYDIRLGLSLSLSLFFLLLPLLSFLFSTLFFSILWIQGGNWKLFVDGWTLGRIKTVAIVQEYMSCSRSNWNSVLRSD